MVVSMVQNFLHWLVIRLTGGQATTQQLVTAQLETKFKSHAKNVAFCQSHLEGKDPLHSSQMMLGEHRNQSSCYCSANTPAGSLFHPPVEKGKHLTQITSQLVPLALPKQSVYLGFFPLSFTSYSSQKQSPSLSSIRQLRQQFPW